MHRNTNKTKENPQFEPRAQGEENQYKMRSRTKMKRTEWKVADLKKELATHEDFKNQRSMLEEYIVSRHSRDHSCEFIPKFHCELNECELVWAMGKDMFIRKNNFQTATHIERLKAVHPQKPICWRCSVEKRFTKSEFCD
eukprot:129792_1